MGAILRYSGICLALLGGLSLAGCQSTVQNNRIIASAFNLTTGMQQKLMDRYAPETVRVHSNIVYATEQNLNLDLYQPQNVQELGPRPTVIWIHGGGWISGSKEHARGYFKLLAAQGYNVVAVQYQFAPQVVYPAQLHQINQALEFIKTHAERYQIDARQLYLAGDSAGANLASHYAALLTNPEFARQSGFRPSIQPEQLRGLILHCGIYDLESFIHQAPELKIMEWGVDNLLQAYIGDQKENTQFLQQISPIHQLSTTYPPVFISGGNKDFLTDTQSIPFVRALEAKNIPVMPVFYPESKAWLIHEYQFFMAKKESQQTFFKTIEFLHQHSL